MLKKFIKTDGGEVAINPDWVMSVSAELKDGQPCTTIWSEKTCWCVKETYDTVIKTLNNVI